jgi:hypothetical protein
MLIGIRFRRVIHKSFNKIHGVNDYIALRMHEAKEKAKKKSRAAAGASVNPDYKEEDFDWTKLGFTEKFSVIHPFIIRNRIRFAVTSYFNNKVHPFSEVALN